ncbi:MAG: lysoplasmalogenase [Alistipes sp.]|jgi:alkenylglycerophosphocholine/alkenylglycerophosphoethanolamine hydrolase|nr:lysoplasmalogenase [Alistipes sp.]MBQ5786107.1 lysoplasmalogenase [Alistipes sp.]
MNTNGKLYFYEIIGVFFILTLYYFIAEHSSWFIAMPALFLGLATLAHSREGGWAIPAALFLSAIGDYQGSEHNFILQVLFFALAHIFYIVDFLPKRNLSNRNKYVASIPYIYAVAFLILLISHMNHAVEMVAVVIYALIIATMGASALVMEIKHKWWYVIAAVLFIFSDSVIVYNKYIEHIPNASLWIMTTYYAAQGLFATLCLLRRKE